MLIITAAELHGAETSIIPLSHLVSFVSLCLPVRRHPEGLLLPVWLAIRRWFLDTKGRGCM